MTKKLVILATAVLIVLGFSAMVAAHGDTSCFKWDQCSNNNCDSDWNCVPNTPPPAPQPTPQPTPSPITVVPAPTPPTPVPQPSSAPVQQTQPVETFQGK